MQPIDHRRSSGRRQPSRHGPAIWLLAAAGICLAPGPPAAAAEHSWTWHEAPDPDELASAIAEMSTIVLAAPDALARDTAPEIGPSSLTIRGAGDDHDPGDHRNPGDDRNPGRTTDAASFRFPGQTAAAGAGAGDRIRATGRFDAVVTACLIVARDHFPPRVLGIGSDVTWSDWAPGRELYESARGTPAIDALGGELRRGAAPAAGAGEAGSSSGRRAPGESRPPSPFALVAAAAACGYAGYQVWRLVARRA